MKQTLRKILAVLVVLSIVLSVGIIAISGSAAQTIVFSDDFEDGNLTGWANTTIGTVANGKYDVPMDKANLVNVAGTSTLTDYTVEAEVTAYNPNQANNSSTVNVGLIARSSSAGNNGYEFTIRFNKNTPDPVQIALYRRGGSAGFVSGGGERTLKGAMGTNETYDAFATYKLKMELKGSNIKCYVNDTLVFDLNDTAYTSGSAGVRAYVYGARFDNFKITTQQEDVSSATTSAVSSTSSASSDALFFDDFNTGTLADHQSQYGWSNNNTGALVDGRYYLSTGSVYNYLKTVTALNPHFNFDNCTTNDYTVEADVQLDNYVSNSFIGLVARVTSAMNNGYEFGIALNGGVPGARLRKVSDNIILDGITPLTEFGITKGITDTYHLKLTVLGNRIVCYVDEVKVFDKTDTSCVKGVPAIRVAGTNSTGYFDNFKVTNAVIGGTTSSEVSSAPVSSAPPVSSDITSSGVLTPDGSYRFEDNFNSGSAHADWSFSNGQVQNGAYYLPVGGSSISNNWVGTAQAKALSDYGVSADVQFKREGASPIGQPTAGLIFRVQSASTGDCTAYEYTITYHRDGLGMEPGKLYVRLYERGGTAPQIPASNIKKIEDIIYGDAPIDGNYTLRVEVIGNRIVCFVNGYVAFDMTDDSFAKGGFGIRTTGHGAVFDNVVAEEIDAFTAGKQPPVSSDVTSKPTYTYPEGVYYQDDFSTADLINKGWNGSGLSVKDGMLRIAGVNGAYFTGRTDMMPLSNYTVQADVLFEETASSDAGTRLGAIVGRAAGADKGYEFGLFQDYNGNACVRFYIRGVAGETLDRTVLYNWSYGQTYTLKMVFYGKRIMCFVDDELVVDYTSTQEIKGTVGLRRAGYPVLYDNFVVRVSTENEKQGIGKVYPAPEADKDGIYFADNFDSKASIFSGVWGSDSGMIEDGKLLIENNTTVALNATPAYAALKDYTIQADFTLTASEPIDANYCVPSLLARGSYEFSLLYASSGQDAYLRLYDRENSKVLAENRDFAFTLGQTYTLTLVVEGENIRGFVNGELVFAVKDSAHQSGVMGIKAQTTTFAVDNFVLRKVTAADRAGSSITTTPNTGDIAVYVGMAIGLLILSAAVLLLLKRKSVLYN